MGGPLLPWRMGRLNAPWPCSGDSPLALAADGRVFRGRISLGIPARCGLFKATTGGRWQGRRLLPDGPTPHHFDWPALEQTGGGGLG